MRLTPNLFDVIKQQAGKFHGTAPKLLFVGRADNTQGGFTLVELVMTMVIVGILAAVVAPRFFDQNIFQSRGFADQVQTTLRYAQKAAVARRSNVCATYSASPDRLTLTMTVIASCDSALNFSEGNNYVEAPSGVTFSMSPASISFDALGRPTPAATATVGTTTIIVEAETGYVHSP